MFELTYPWLLTLLPLPFLVWFFVARVNIELTAAMRVPFFNAMKGIVEQEKYRLKLHTPLTLLFLIWALLVLALANPRWIGEPQPVTREGHNVMLTLDISPSMEVNDMMFHGHESTRLNIVKHAAEQFIQNRGLDKIGLILFGERAYLQTPLTYDHRNVLLRIADATPGLAGKSSSIGDALGLSVKHLKNVPDKGRVIILLTDGANNSGVLSPMKAAELAKNAGIKVYTIGLGAEANPQSFNGLFLKMNVTDDLDEDTLKAIAKLTGGRYFRATDMPSLQAIYQAINAMETVTQDQETIRPQHDYYPWPLALAYLLLMYMLAERCSVLQAFRRKKNEFRT